MKQSKNQLYINEDVNDILFVVRNHIIGNWRNDGYDGK